MEEKIGANNYKLIRDANIYEKLLYVQSKLKAPKSQYNSFGKYSYRNAEDILEAVKPHCKEVGALIILTDKIVNISNRFYVETTAKFIDTAPINDLPFREISVTASAREEDDKKGVDGSQITGASSSYARKYALNGLLAIDDTKDSDTTNTDNGKNKPTSQEIKKVEVVKKEDDKPFKTEEPKPLTLEEARQMGFTSNGKEYVVATMTDEQLLAMKDYTKMPRLAEACAMELMERAKAKVENEQGQNS